MAKTLTKVLFDRFNYIEDEMNKQSIAKCFHIANVIPQYTHDRDKFLRSNVSVHVYAIKTRIITSDRYCRMSIPLMHPPAMRAMRRYIACNTMQRNTIYEHDAPRRRTLIST